MPALRRHLRWITPLIVLGIAALLRFWALGRPGTLVFDELFYVRDAISQLAHGYPTSWPDSEPDMSGGRATAFGDEAANAVHPPLGKWLIGLGVLLFGPGSGWGWRFAVALTGIATVAVTMRLGYLLTRSLPVSWLAGLLLAVDGVHVTLSRVALLDGFLAFFIVLGALFVWKDLAVRSEISVKSVEFAQKRLTEPGSTDVTALWRPWLLAAGLAFGAAAAVKWSGLYPLAFFLVLSAVWDLVLRLRSGSARPMIRSALNALAIAAYTLPATALAYLATWAGWILTPGGHERNSGDHWFASLVDYHAAMFAWHSTLDAEHPYAAHPLSWPLGLKPTAMYIERWSDTTGEMVSGISALPNPLVTWGGVAALVMLAALAITRRRDPLTITAAFVLVGYLSGWLPWVLTLSRSAVFHFYTVVLTPFSALALAIVLAMLCSLRIRTPLGVARPLLLDNATRTGRRAAVAVFVGAALLVGLLFWPVWSAMPVSDWFWRSHMWLPGWN